jgi:hypothetical protein
VRAHIDLVISRCPGVVAEMVKVAMATGARQGELLKARRDSVDHDRRQLTIIGKGKKQRVIDLDPFGGYALISAVPAYAGKPLLFFSRPCPSLRPAGQIHMQKARFRASRTGISLSAPEFILPRAARALECVTEERFGLATTRDAHGRLRAIHNPSSARQNLPLTLCGLVGDAGKGRRAFAPPFPMSGC